MMHIHIELQPMSLAQQLPSSTVASSPSWGESTNNILSISSASVDDAEADFTSTGTGRFPLVQRHFWLKGLLSWLLSKVGLSPRTNQPIYARTSLEDWLVRNRLSKKAPLRKDENRWFLVVILSSLIVTTLVPPCFPFKRFSIFPCFWSIRIPSKRQ